MKKYDFFRSWNPETLFLRIPSVFLWLIFLVSGKILENPLQLQSIDTLNLLYLCFHSQYVGEIACKTYHYKQDRYSLAYVGPRDLKRKWPFSKFNENSLFWSPNCVNFIRERIILYRIPIRVHGQEDKVIN